MDESAQDREVAGPDTGLVDGLAREFDVPAEVVEVIYREEAHRLEAQARIKTFLGVLVAGRVRAELRRRAPVS